MGVVFQFLVNTGRKILAILENIFFQISFSKSKIFPRGIQDEET